MYLPAAFSEHDWRRIRRLVEANPFATLVTGTGSRPEASHLPLLLDPHAHALLGHLAAANPQAGALADAREVLVVFPGPHGYVSPACYESPGVPTWNYAAVHVYARPEIVGTEEAVRAIVDALTAVHEAGRAQPWAPRYPDSALRAIVGFRLHITEVQAKFKLSQNRSAADRRKVRAALEGSEDAPARALAGLMAERGD